MASQITHCPHCGKELMIVPPSVVVGVRSLGHGGRSSTSWWSPVQEAWRSLGEASAPFDQALSSFVQGARSLGDNARSHQQGPQSFDQTVSPLAPWSAPLDRTSRSPDQDPRSLGADVLSPGEKHTSKIYRERSSSDIKYPLIANLISGGMVLVITGATTLVIKFSEPIMGALWLRKVQMWIGSNWYLITIAAPLATMATLWFRWQLPEALDDRSLIAAVQEHERRPDPQPVEIKPPAVNLEFNERNERGRIERQVRATLSAPASNHDGLWRYCQALAQDRAFPSLEGGKGGPGAQAFGYTGNELDAWRKEAERAGLLIAPTKQNQPWTITERGYGAFARIGQQKLREASYGL